MTASLPNVLVPRGRAPFARDEGAERALAAQLNLHELRGWRMGSLRWAVAASLVFWFHAHWPLVPGVLLWLAGLLEATALVLAAGYAVLEHQWARRAARLRAQRLGVVIHAPWTVKHEVRSGLWYGLAAVSALPWMAAVTDRALPQPLLWSLTLAAAALAGLLAVSQRSAWALRSGTSEALDERALKKRYRARAVLFCAGALALVGGLAAGSWALNAVPQIERAEADRDRWQRPADVVQALNVTEEAVVVDVGSGVGYFALKLSDRVGERGRVLAVDVRAVPLLVLRARALLRARGNVTAIHADFAEADLPRGGVDAVLVANTYHELADPRAALDHAFAALRPGGRLVVVDPSDAGEDPSQPPVAHHHASSASALKRLQAAGFEVVRHEEGFIDAPGQSWWLVVVRRPVISRTGGRP